MFSSMAALPASHGWGGKIPEDGTRPAVGRPNSREDLSSGRRKKPCHPRQVVSAADPRVGGQAGPRRRERPGCPGHDQPFTGASALRAGGKDLRQFGCSCSRWPQPGRYLRSPLRSDTPGCPPLAPHRWQRAAWPCSPLLIICVTLSKWLSLPGGSPALLASPVLYGERRQEGSCPRVTGLPGEDSLEPGLGRECPIRSAVCKAASHLRSLHRIPISQLWKLRLREAKRLAWGHTRATEAGF